MQSTAAHFPCTLSLSTWGSFCGAVLGQLAQILSQQRLASSLSHAVDCGLPVLHTREFLWSSPWAVSSNSQPTVLGQLLVTCSRPPPACAPYKGVLRSSPWAVSSNSQPTVLGQYLVTCRRPRLACAPHEGDFLNSLEEDHLPIYSVVTFWQGEYTHNEVFGKPCFRGVFVERSLSSQLKFSAHSAWPVPCQMQATVARLCSTWGRFLELSWGGPPPYI